MALEIKQSIRMSQQLVVTPQLQQAITLLQLPRLELSTLIQKELVENPVLEEAAETEQELDPDGNKPSNAEMHEKAREEDRGHDHSGDEVGNKDGEFKEPENFDWENYLTNTYNAPGYAMERQISERIPDDGPTYENFLRQGET